jgi:hypothetical protein
MLGFSRERAAYIGLLTARDNGRAALLRRGALAWGNRGQRGIATTPANRGSRCGDTTRSGDEHEQGDDGFVEHHCEDWVEAMEILKAAAVGLGDRRVMSCLLINLLPWLTEPNSGNSSSILFLLHSVRGIPC